MIILTIMLMDILTGMEFDLFTPSFPEIKDIFHLTPFWLELSLSINFIGYCISLFLVGDLADRYGRKPIILWGLFTFIVGSICCLSNINYSIFLTGRFLQGLGIAAPSILSFLIVADRYTIKKQQSLLAILNASMNTAVAFAPVIGSFITKYFHWRGNFLVLLFLSMLTFLMTIFFIPYRQPLHKNIFSLQQYIDIFKSKMIVLLMIYFMLMFIPYWIFVGISPLLYMKNLGVSLEYFGFYQGSLALIFALGSLLFGFIVHRYDHKEMLSVANIIFFLSVICILLVTVKYSHNPLLITLSFIPLVIGQIIPGYILYPLYLNLMPEAKGRLTALIQGGRLIFASLGLAVTGYFYNGSIRNTGIIVTITVLLGIIVMRFIIKHWESINHKDLVNQSTKSSPTSTDSPSKTY